MLDTEARVQDKHQSDVEQRHTDESLVTCVPESTFIATLQFPR